MRPWLLLLAILLSPVAVWVSLWWVAARPDTPFLSDSPGAEWIIDARPAWFLSQPLARLETVFHQTFELGEVPPQAPLRVRAFRNGRVVINGRVALPMRDNENSWKVPREVDVAQHLRRGENDVAIVVANGDGPPAVWCHLRAGATEISTDETWLASLAGAAPQPALLAKAVKPRAELTTPREQVWPSIRERWPTLLLFALLAGAAWLSYETSTAHRAPLPSDAVPRDHVAYYVYAGVAVLWTLLVWNNVGWLPPDAGFDNMAHWQYIDYLQSHYALPTADYGFQTHQAPLYYMLAAAVLEVLHTPAMTPAGLTILRGLSLLLGLLHLWFILLSLRLLFPNQSGRQVIGLVFAACLPIHLFIFQYTTNETLTATLSSASLYLALRIVCQGRSGFWDFLWLGACLGGALSSKLTAIVLPPVVLGVLAIWLVLRDGFQPAKLLKTIGVAAVVCALLGGWHYARLTLGHGTPLVRQIDHFDMSQVSVQPGFRMASHFLPSREPLSDPFMAGLHSVPDALYSTAWGDGRWGGSGSMRVRPPWNYDLMAAGYLLALIPMAAIATGLLAAVATLHRQPGAAWILLLGVLLLMAAALIYENLRHPSLYVCKAWYALPASVAICAAVAWGANCGVLGRAWVRGLVWVPLGTWALCALASFWIVGNSAPAFTALGASHISANRTTLGAAYVARAVELKPDDAEAWYWRAEASRASGVPREAHDAYRRAIRSNPNDTDARVGRAQMLLAIEDLRGAIALLDEAVELAPHAPTAHRLLAIARQRQGHLEEALDASRRSILLTPGDWTTHTLTAQLYFELGRPAAAALHCLYALRLNPVDVDARAVLDQVPLEAIDLSDAVRANSLVFPSPRRVVRVIGELAWRLATQPDPEARDGALALRLAQRGEALAPDDPRCLQALAAALAAGGRYDEAAAVAERAATLAEQQGRRVLMHHLARQLAVYQAGKPFRDHADSWTFRTDPGDA